MDLSKEDKALLRQALGIAINTERGRIAANPYGPWSDESREFVEAARALHDRLGEET